MAKSVIINGVTYASVPYVNIPLSAGGGNAKFVDTDSGDATAADIRNGKKVWVGGEEVIGSAQEKSDTDVTVSGKTVTVPAGIYDESVQKSVSDGTVTPNVTVSGDELSDTQSDYPITVTPKATVGAAGYVAAVADGAAVTKYIQVEDKTATPTTAAQEITPTAGKLIKKVTVAAVNLTGDAPASAVMAGYTFYNSSLTKLTGTATVPTVSQDGTTKVLSIT